MLLRLASTIVALGLLSSAGPAFAQEQIEVVQADSGNTAWILAATALVLLMTLPGLALFYGGLVRTKNFLSVLVQCGAIAAIVSILWGVVGYSLAFADGAGGVVGSLKNVMFSNFVIGDGIVLRDDTTINEALFAMFQMTFAIITPALIVGAWVERARFGWVVAFCALWSILVYAPVTHWVWGGGWLAEENVVDFAGGIVVHTTAGVSALVVALMMGKRSGFPKTLMLPHSPALTVTGAGLLWVGWFGFNGGSALAADFGASTAIINTHLAASMAALVWLLIEKIKVGKSTAVGFATGAIAGLATITPAAGSVGPMGALILGLLAGIVCFYAVGLVKNTFGIDDSLDVFAVHGVGGIIGSVLLAILAGSAFDGQGLPDGMTMASQLWVQIKAVGVVAVWSAVVTLIIGYMVSMAIPMRVSKDAERDGLDIASHGERAWDLD